MSALLPWLTFLVEHIDVIEEVYTAIKGGASKEDVKKAVRGTIIAASDAAIQEELGPL